MDQKYTLALLALIIAGSLFSTLRSCRPPSGGRENFVHMGKRLGADVAASLEAGKRVLLLSREGEDATLAAQVAACEDALAANGIAATRAHAPRPGIDDPHYETGIAAPDIAALIPDGDPPDAIVSFVGLPGKIPKALKADLILVGLSEAEARAALRTPRVTLVYAYSGSFLGDTTPRNPEEWFDLYCRVIRRETGDR